MSDIIDDRFWSIARRRRALLDELAELDAEMAVLNRQEEAEVLRTADALLPRMSVKVCGEWVLFRRLNDAGEMVLTRDGSVCEWTYMPTTGETFAWCEIF